MADTPSMAQNARSEGSCYVALTRDQLNVLETMDRVRSPKAGAVIIFAGTTRDNFDGKPVKELDYTSYEPKALSTMLQICREIYTKHGLNSIAMIHRLGVVPIGEVSILIAVSSPHRKAAWLAGEEALEECKKKVEIWKKEEFGGENGGVWRANRDGTAGVRIDMKANTKHDENDLQGENSNVSRPLPPIEKGHGPVVHPKDIKEGS